MYLYPSEISLPDFSRVCGSKWSVIACDQFTSDRAYWEACDRYAGDAPSALRLILPEAYLSSDNERFISAINRNMEVYASEVLKELEPGYVLVCRTQPDGRKRVGLMGTIDLDDYSFAPDAKTPVRSTEGTVAERIPPRVKIRRDAMYELPHVMLLMCDKEDRVMKAAEKCTSKVLYDYDLMEGGGHIKGEFVPGEHAEVLNSAISALGEGQAQPFVFAVGDGNHSLATAKTIYEEMKANSPESAKTSPARYALVEVVNIFSDALDFEPIYRCVTALSDTEAVVQSLRDYAERCAADPECAGYGAQDIKYITKHCEGVVHFAHGSHSLAVGTVQKFLDETKPGEVDYIHDTDELCRLASEEGTLGLMFDTMTKEQLFSSVAADGPLPRKTFSMGHARDKRYYTEARKIR